MDCDCEFDRAQRLRRPVRAVYLTGKGGTVRRTVRRLSKFLTVEHDPAPTTRIEREGSLPCREPHDIALIAPHGADHETIDRKALQRAQVRG